MRNAGRDAAHDADIGRPADYTDRMARPRIDRLNVHIDPAPPDGAIRFLKSDLDPGIEVTCGPQPAPEADILVSGRPTRDRLDECPRLRALVVPYAGVPAETRALLLSSFPDLEVYNLHHNASAAAELGVALLLAAAKAIVPADRALRRGDWRTRYDGESTLILAGKTAVVLGLGAIGGRIAAICHSLGMEVHAVRRRSDLQAAPYVSVHPPSSLSFVLPLADALLVCLPLTPETEGLLGDRELRLLRPSSVLVNIARGAIVVEHALFHALREHRIAAAGIDVWYRYPSAPAERENTPPSQYPFHELDNVVMSPHRGGAFGTEELEKERMHELAGTLNAVARGESVPHRVDMLAGY